MADQLPTIQNFYDAEKDLRTLSAVSNSRDPDTGAAIATWETRTGGQTDTIEGRLDKLGQVVAGDTTSGCMLASNQQVVLNNTVGSTGFGNYYSWNGTYPIGGHIVLSGTDPAITAGYAVRTSTTVAGAITTVAELASGRYGVGSVVRVSDRGSAIAAIEYGSSYNGETTLPAGVGQIARIDQTFLDKVETYSSLQNAVNYCKQLGINTLVVDSQVASPDISNKGAVSLVGNGSVSGVYRKRVAKKTDPISAAFNDINPEVHLKRFLSKTNPVVVVVGDSISTETGANVPPADSLYYRLKSRLVSTFPDKTITFYNRAIGGETYFTAVGLPSSFPTWYTDQNRGWVRYVGDLNPDLVIFNFGMNDSSNLHTNKLTEYQGYFDNVGVFPAGRPDAIYCTNLTPAVDTTYAGLGSEASQSGRDHVAGFTRTFAKAIGSGLLDFHRQCTIVKDGYDPTDTYLERVGAITPVNGAVAATAYPCTDFKLDLTLSIASGANMAVRLGSPADAAIDAAGRGSYAVVYNNSGTFKVDFFTADIISDANIYGSITTTSPVPSGSFVLSVEKRQNTAIFSINGAIVASFDKLRVAGADVAPKAGDATYTSGTITSATLWVGRYKTYQQSVVNDNMWGTSDATATQRQPFGGNGANHPSSIGCASVFQPVIDSANFSGVRELTGSPTLMNSWRAVSGKMASKAVRIGKFVTISFTVQVPVTGTPAKGVVLNVPADFRPPAGLSSYAVIQTTNSSGAPVLCDISSNGDVQIYTNVDAIAFGVINFVLP